MTKAIFVFISSFLLLTPVVFNAGEVSSSIQMMCCLPFLLFLGIPHGAIDNVLYMRNNKISNFRFITIYLVFVGLNVALWLIVPSIAYLLFLVLSAYHFGQSQFTHYFSRQEIPHQIFFLFWGVAVLSGMIYFNIAEIHQIMSNYEDFAVFSPLHQEQTMFVLFVISSGFTVISMLVFCWRNGLKIEQMMMEILILGLILICFFLMPLLIGFTLYFVILHSFKVLREEYNYLNSEKIVASWAGFVKMVAPFTLMSIGGIAFLFGLIYLDFWNISYGYMLLIVISSITLPHVFVMNQFYTFLFSKGFFKYSGKGQ